MSGIHKISRIISQTRLDGEVVDNNRDSIELIKEAETKKNIHRFKNDIYFCAYKTNYENDNSIMLLFTMKLPGPPTGSSTSSEMVIDIVSLIEGLISSSKGMR